ncbi:MAG: hypothetical protein PF450_10265, partial [Bacteroidales bacterium]|nr:hypothetical protein [Bacteroidales bacterium]
DVNGRTITNLKEFRKNDPNAVVFDSAFEWKIYNRLKQTGLNVIFKPKPIIIVPKMNGVELDYTKAERTELRIALRSVVTKAQKSKVTSEFNLTHKKTLIENVIQPLTWSIDFYLPDHGLYVEAKGYPNDAFPLKLKFARYLLSVTHIQIGVVRTLKECNDLIIHLTKKK